MCFYNEGEWSASLVLDDVLTADSPIKCGECRRVIEAGTQYRRIYLQEHEVCYDCEGEGKECDCEKANLGETWTARRCMECDKFLQAVSAAEIEEGCPAHESQPSLDGMFDEIQEFDRNDKERYFAKARAMFPELETSYLAMARGKVFRSWESEV